MSTRCFLCFVHRWYFLQKAVSLSLAAKPLGRALLSVETGPSTVSCVLLRRTCLRRTPPHNSRSAHQCAGRAVYFAAAKYGKAGRPPGVATLVAVRGLVPPKVSGFLAVYVSRFSRNDDLFYGIALGVYCLLAEGPASLFRNPKNTFEHQLRSTVFC